MGPPGSLEQRAQRKIAEPLVAKTVDKLFPDKEPVSRKIMSFAAEAFSFNDFNEAVASALEKPANGWWGYDEWASDGSDEEDDDQEAVHQHFDGDGRGPYARADVDIVVVAETIEQARRVIDATVSKVTRRLKNFRIYETPCSIQIIGDFPQRHVQIITVINKSLDEYMLHVDLDCTALLFDGRDLFGAPRSYMALSSGYNIVPQQMLEIRSDTPRRLHKYAIRGFASLVPGVLSARAYELLEQARAIRVGRDGLKYLDLAWWTDSHAALDAICGKEGRVYSETVEGNE